MIEIQIKPNNDASQTVLFADNPNMRQRDITVERHIGNDEDPENIDLNPTSAVSTAATHVKSTYTFFRGIIHTILSSDFICCMK